MNPNAKVTAGQPARKDRMSDKIIPLRRPEAKPVDTPSLAEALAHLPDDAPLLLQITVQDPTGK